MNKGEKTLDAAACYAILKAHDSRFDGRIYVGVSSTGIYCRPICRVKIPKAENCSFYASAAAAESLGFRPCLKCRPELAPGNSSMDSAARIARKAAIAIEEGYLTGSSLRELADMFGITDRHLRRAFTVEYGVYHGTKYLPNRIGPVSGVTLGLAVSVGGIAVPIMGRVKTETNGGMR